MDSRERTFFRNALTNTSVSLGRSIRSFSPSIPRLTKFNFLPHISNFNLLDCSLSHLLSKFGTCVLWSSLNSVRAYSTWLSMTSTLSSTTSPSTSLHQFACLCRFVVAGTTQQYLQMFYIHNLPCWFTDLNFKYDRPCRVDRILLQSFLECYFKWYGLQSGKAYIRNSQCR